LYRPLSTAIGHIWQDRPVRSGDAGTDGPAATRVFLSVAGLDRPWGRWIGQELRRAGFEVEYDEWSWPAGSSFLDLMEAALGRADRVVAVVSPAYLSRTTYGREEREAAQRLAHVRDGLLIPILVADCELPPLLGRLSNVSLVGLDESAARRAVVAAVRGPRAPGLDERMPFPGSGHAGRRPPDLLSADLPAAPFPGGAVTVLHLSDLRFSARKPLDLPGSTTADDAATPDTLIDRLVDDLGRIWASEGLAPDLLVVTGDLTEIGYKVEFDRVLACLVRLSDRLGLARDRVVIVPGDHDVNRKLCAGYFNTCEGHDTAPVWPYWPKWHLFERMFNAFYEGMGGATFAVGQPWSLFAVPDLKVVVAGLNSTMTESHRSEDHYGSVGEAQVHWFAERLEGYRRDGWLRIGAVHHNPRRAAVRDDESNLRDTDVVDRVLGPRLHLFLHGGAHMTSTEYLGASGVPVLSAGTAVNGYQLLRIDAAGLTRHPRASASESEPSTRLDRRWVDATAVFPPRAGGAGRDRGDRSARDRPPDESDSFLDRVAEVARLRHDKAQVSRIDGGAGTPAYLRLTCREDSVVTPQRPVGAFDGAPARADVDAFAENVHSGYAASDQTLVSDLVYGGPRVDEDLRRYARSRGVHLVSFVEYQGLLDLGRYVGRQTDRLANDALYPPPLYLPQRFRRISRDGNDDAEVEDGVLDRVIAWRRRTRPGSCWYSAISAGARRSCCTSWPVLCRTSCRTWCPYWWSCAPWRRRTRWTIWWRPACSIPGRRVSTPAGSATCCAPAGSY
jgi:hypothetical protein